MNEIVQRYKVTRVERLHDVASKVEVRAQNFAGAPTSVLRYECAVECQPKVGQMLAVTIAQVPER